MPVCPWYRLCLVEKGACCSCPIGCAVAQTIDSVLHARRTPQPAESKEKADNNAMVPCHYYRSKGWSCSMGLLDMCKEEPCMLTVAQHQ